MGLASAGGAGACEVCRALFGVNVEPEVCVRGRGERVSCTGGDHNNKACMSGRVVVSEWKCDSTTVGSRVGDVLCWHNAGCGGEV